MMHTSALYCTMVLFHCNDIIWQYCFSMNFTVQILNGYKNAACFWRWFAAHYIWYHTRILSFNNIYYHLLSKMRHFCATFYGTVYHNGIVPCNAIWCHISLFCIIMVSQVDTMFLSTLLCNLGICKNLTAILHGTIYHNAIVSFNGF